MRLTVKYENLEEKECARLRVLLDGYDVKLQKIGEGPMLFANADLAEALEIVKIAAGFPYRELMLRS